MQVLRTQGSNTCTGSNLKAPKLAHAQRNAKNAKIQTNQALASDIAFGFCIFCIFRFGFVFVFLESAGFESEAIKHRLKKGVFLQVPSRSTANSSVLNTEKVASENAFRFRVCCFLEPFVA